MRHAILHRRKPIFGEAEGTPHRCPTRQNQHIPSKTKNILEESRSKPGSEISSSCCDFLERPTRHVVQPDVPQNGIPLVLTHSHVSTHLRLSFRLPGVPRFKRAQNLGSNRATAGRPARPLRSERGKFLEVRIGQRPGVEAAALEALAPETMKTCWVWGKHGEKHLV